jgi:hypothetical protein
LPAPKSQIARGALTLPPASAAAETRRCRCSHRLTGFLSLNVMSA